MFIFHFSGSFVAPAGIVCATKRNNWIKFSESYGWCDHKKWRFSVEKRRELMRATKGLLLMMNGNVTKVSTQSFIVLLTFPWLFPKNTSTRQSYRQKSHSRWICSCTKTAKINRMIIENEVEVVQQLERGCTKRAHSRQSWGRFFFLLLAFARFASMLAKVKCLARGKTIRKILV